MERVRKREWGENENGERQKMDRERKSERGRDREDRERRGEAYRKFSQISDTFY